MTPREFRSLALLPAAGGGLGGWLHFGEPAGWPGLGAAVGAGLALWPLVLLAAVFGIGPALAAVFVPRRWRMAYRRDRPRPAIPARLRRAVLAADRYACLWCEEQAGLQIDHIRPWSCGGLSCLFNLAVLCGRCNRVKSNYWRYRRSGVVVYRSFPGSADQVTAAMILAAERRARCNPARWFRAAWSLGA